MLEIIIKHVTYSGYTGSAMSQDDILAGHQYLRHPQGADFCTETSAQDEPCGLPLAAHPEGQSEIVGP